MTATVDTTTATTDGTGTLVAGVNHLAVLVRDLDRWVEFWTGVFGATFAELPDHRGRHGLMALDPAGTSMLHAFEISAEVSGGEFPGPDMFRRGRLDHLGVNAAGEAALLELRDRLVARGASDGSVRLFGGRNLSVHAVDPERMDFEVCCLRTGDVLGEGEYEIAH
jgi:catechol 2,3-dioxygenase-like lactoylglutathione lyase family enzyme